MSGGVGSGRIAADRMRQLLRTYLVLGSPNCRDHPLRVLEAALDGGVTLVQFREKGPGALTGEPLRALAAQLLAACRRRGVPFLVNDDVELALAIHADGVHVGQEDEAAARVRARIGDRIAHRGDDGLALGGNVALDDGAHVVVQDGQQQLGGLLG